MKKNIKGGMIALICAIIVLTPLGKILLYLFPPLEDHDLILLLADLEHRLSLNIHKTCFDNNNQPMLLQVMLEPMLFLNNYKTYSYNNYFVAMLLIK